MPHVLVELAKDRKFPEELKATAAGALAGTLNVNLRAQAGKLFPMPPTKDNRPIPQMTDLLVFNGEVDHGREIFTKATCVTCHKAEGKGVDFGPDLSTIGSKLSKLALYEAILNPSSGIATSYQAFQVITESGKTHTGLIVSETDNHLSLKVPGGQIIEVARDEVAEKTKLKVSAMPSGLMQLITLDDLIDLVEYLTTLKS
jgi:putative heme-binding domain-containing protein